MEYTRLGSSGLKISKVILGAMSYGSSEWQDWVLNEEEALPLLEHAYNVGLNTWDTVSSSSFFARKPADVTTRPSSSCPLLIPKLSSLLVW